MAAKLRTGDRVVIIDLPGRWRIADCDPPWYWLEAKDSDAARLANLSKDGKLGFKQRDIKPDSTEQGELT